MDANELLPATLLAELERLQLRTRRRLAGRFAGEHRSPHFGTSVDFADYREYHPGDDYRRIDYPLYARTGHLFIRLFEAEDDVSVRLVLDRSASMGFHGKLDQARRMAAAIGFVALLRRDTVTLHTEPASVHRAATSGATPRAACSPTSPRSTPPARPTSPAPPATCSPSPARSASRSSSPTCSTTGGTGRSTGWSPAAARRPCCTSSPTTSCTPTRAATWRWSTWRPASRCR